MKDFDDTVFMPYQRQDPEFPTQDLNGVVQMRFTGVFTGESFPNWKSSLGKANATTPRTIETRTLESYTPLDLRMKVRPKGSSEVRDFSLVGALTVVGNRYFTPAYIPDNIKADARAKAYAKLSSRTVHESGGVFAGELGQTLRMLRSPLAALTGGAQQYLDRVLYRSLKANVRGMNQHSKRRVLTDIVVNTWLEFQYGIQPLISDIENICLKVDYLQQGKYLHATQVKSQYKYDTVSETIIDSVPMYQTTIDSTINTATSYRLYTTIGVLPLVTNPVNVQLGLSGLQWIPTLYNLIPYSFVFDYVANLNQLANSVPNVNTETVYVSQTEVTESRTTVVSTSRGLTSPYFEIDSVISDVPGSATHLLKTLNRTPNLSFPSFAWKVPNVKQLTNIAALILSNQRTSYKLRGL